MTALAVIGALAIVAVITTLFFTLMTLLMPSRRLLG